MVSANHASSNSAQNKIMAAARFVVVSDDDVNAFSEQQENDNTKKKTLYDLKIFREFLETCDEKREIENITPAELQAIIKKFGLAVRKKTTATSMSPRLSELFYKVSTAIFEKITLDSQFLTTRNSTKYKIF